MEFGLGASRTDTAKLLEVLQGLEGSADAARDIVAAFPLPRNPET